MHGFRPTDRSDLEPIAANLREADQQEIAASTGWSPLAALMVGLENSEHCYTMFSDQTLVGMFGVHKSGAIWMLCTNDLPKCATRFLRESLNWIDVWQEKYPRLWNYVDARNETHIKWLKWLGFKFVKLHEKF